MKGRANPDPKKRYTRPKIAEKPARPPIKLPSPRPEHYCPCCGLSRTHWAGCPEGGSE